MMQMMGMNYEKQQRWTEGNFRMLRSSNLTRSRSNGRLPNINDPQSYFGRWPTIFCWRLPYFDVFSTKPAARVLQGFSGCLIVEHLDALVQGVLKPFTWALAGRSLPKLEKMASQCRSRPKVSVDDCPLLGDEVSHESEAWFRKMDEKGSKWLRLDFHLFM